MMNNNSSFLFSKTESHIPAKRVLFCASTLSHIQNFHLPYLQAFAQQGWEVWVAANSSAPVPFAHQVVALPFQKKLFSPKNVRAIFALRRLMKEKHFSLVSVHTTLAGAVCRAAAMLLHHRPQIFYTCHGYLFSAKGLKKWVYLLPELLCAPVTDTLLVMNQEDKEIARRFHLYRNRLCLIPGMGYRDNLFAPLPALQRRCRRQALAQSLFGRTPDEKQLVLFVYAAEFSSRKNHQLLLRAFAQAAGQMPHARLLLAGDGALLNQCRTLSQELGIWGQVTFLGQVKDIATLYPLCDVAVSPCKIEGLPFHLMEAMACGLPVVASSIKGHVDLVDSGTNGLLFLPEHVETMAQAMVSLYGDPALRCRLGSAALVSSAPYGLSHVMPQVLSLYPLK